MAPGGVAVLFARSDSIYKSMPQCDVWDAERDALKWPGGCPVIAHPPCRAWGELKHMANPPPGERELAPWAVTQVRRWGGVLEHPRKSALWAFCALPAPGAGKDRYGGWTLGIVQHEWGHLAEKRTLLYIVGLDPRELPAVPLVLGTATHVIARNNARNPDGTWKYNHAPEVPRRDRDATPLQLAEWLVALAQGVRPPARCFSGPISGGFPGR
jgi:hypothetical protein